MKSITLPFYWGQRVTIDGDIVGCVTGIMLHDGSIQYEVATIHDGKRNTDWYYEFELGFSKKSEEIKIGFEKRS